MLKKLKRFNLLTLKFHWKLLFWLTDEKWDTKGFLLSEEKIQTILPRLKEGSILFKWDRKKWNLNFRHSIFTRISDLQKNKIDLASKYIWPMCKKIIFFCLTNKKKGGKSTPLFLASFIWKINVDSKLKIKWRKEKVEKKKFGSNFFFFLFPVQMVKIPRCSVHWRNQTL